MAFRNRLLTAVIGLFFATDEPPNQRIEIGPGPDEPGRNEIRFYSALDEPATNMETAPGIISVSGTRVDLPVDESRGELLVRAPEIDGFEGPSTLWSNRVSDLGVYLARIIHTAGVHDFVGDTVMDNVTVDNITITPGGVVSIDGGLLSFNIGVTISGVDIGTESGVTSINGERTVAHGLLAVPAMIIPMMLGATGDLVDAYVSARTDVDFTCEFRRRTDGSLFTSSNVVFMWMVITI